MTKILIQKAVIGWLLYVGDVNSGRPLITRLVATCSVTKYRTGWRCMRNGACAMFQSFNIFKMYVCMHQCFKSALQCQFLGYFGSLLLVLASHRRFAMLFSPYWLDKILMLQIYVNTSWWPKHKSQISRVHFQVYGLGLYNQTREKTALEGNQPFIQTEALSNEHPSVKKGSSTPLQMQ